MRASNRSNTQCMIAVEALGTIFTVRCYVLTGGGGHGAFYANTLFEGLLTHWLYTQFPLPY